MIALLPCPFTCNGFRPNHWRTFTPKLSRRSRRRRALIFGQKSRSGSENWGRGHVFRGRERQCFVTRTGEGTEEVSKASRQASRLTRQSGDALLRLEVKPDAAEGKAGTPYLQRRRTLNAERRPPPAHSVGRYMRSTMLRTYCSSVMPSRDSSGKETRPRRRWASWR
jgi:hypothetical protein